MIFLRNSSGIRHLVCDIRLVLKALKIINFLRRTCLVPLYRAVFTAHPTFALKKDVSQAVVYDAVTEEISKPLDAFPHEIN